MKQLLFALCAALALVSCGGGGTGDTAQTAVGSEVLKAKPVVTDDFTLVAQQVSMANTTAAGDQVLRTIGATSDGGYTVAWVSGTSTLSAPPAHSASYSTAQATRSATRLPSRRCRSLQEN